MKKLKAILFSLAALFAAALPAGALSACRKPQYADALKIGALDVPKTLMPYDSIAGTSTLVAGMLYDTLLGSQSEPADYAGGEDYYFPDGEKYVPLDKKENPYMFTDGLVKVEGAYQKKDGGKYGWERYAADPDERRAMLQRKEIRKGVRLGPKGEEVFSETDAEFEARAELAVPKTWLKYTFGLVEGNTWNDGEVFNADDIKFTFDYIVKNRGGVSAISTFLTNYVKSYSLDGGNTFDMHLSSQKLSDIKTICNSILILPEHIWKNYPNPMAVSNLDNPVGTGAYKLEQFNQSQSVVLKLRDDYAFKDKLFAKAPIERIMIMRLENIEIQLTSLNKGDIDVIWESLEASKAYLIGEKADLYPNIKLSSVEYDFITTLLINAGDKGRFGDDKFGGNGRALRQAVSLAVDQERLIRDVLYGGGTAVNGGLVSPGQPHALLDDRGDYLKKEFNIDRANAILDGAGFNKDGSGYRRAPDGSELTIDILAGIYSQRLVQALVEDFEKIGLRFEYRQGDGQTSQNVKYEKGANFDAYINSVVYASDRLLMFDARYGVYENGSPRLFNYSGIKDETLIDLIFDMDYETGIEEQYEKARAVQRYLEQLYLEIPLYSPNYISAYTEKNFKGWIKMTSNGIYNGASLRFLEKTA
ncbi:MAG: ABC transporter substrate-binding protein [Clostridiales bacterium]|jgi:peptide/nickel transport system substrate-binding protein|nr:ABC transporter substrate-binding protein [Clostridiales bacterium]